MRYYDAVENTRSRQQAALLFVAPLIFHPTSVPENGAYGRFYHCHFGRGSLDRLSVCRIGCRHRCRRNLLVPIRLGFAVRTDVKKNQ